HFVVDAHAIVNRIAGFVGLPGPHHMPPIRMPGIGSAAGTISPGAMAGNHTTATAAANDTRPTTRENRGPNGVTFSTATVAASTAIAAMFITPNATIRVIKVAQQPRQKAP